MFKVQIDQPPAKLHVGKRRGLDRRPGVQPEERVPHRAAAAASRIRGDSLCRPGAGAAPLGAILLLRDGALDGGEDDPRERNPRRRPQRPRVRRALHRHHAEVVDQLVDPLALVTFFEVRIDAGVRVGQLLAVLPVRLRHRASTSTTSGARLLPPTPALPLPLEHGEGHIDARLDALVDGKVALDSRHGAAQPPDQLLQAPHARLEEVHVAARDLALADGVEAHARRDPGLHARRAAGEFLVAAVLAVPAAVARADVAEVRACAAGAGAVGVLAVGIVGVVGWRVVLEAVVVAGRAGGVVAAAVGVGVAVAVAAVVQRAAVALLGGRRDGATTAARACHARGGQLALRSSQS